MQVRSGKRRYGVGPSGGYFSVLLMLRLALVAPIVAALLATAGCGGRLAGTTINFSVSLDDHERQAMQQLMVRFEEGTSQGASAELPTRFRDEQGIQVNLVAVSASELPEALASVDPEIHVFAQDNVALRPLVDQGLVEDLSDVPIPAEVSPALIPPRFDGKQLFLPFRPNVRLAYANSEALAEAGTRPPRSLQELAPVARKLAVSSGQPMVTLSLSQEDDGAAAAVTISELILAHGGDPRMLNDKGAVAAYQYLRRLWSDGLLARESLFAKYDSEVVYLLSGASWLAENWSFTSAELLEEGRLSAFEVYEGWQGSQAHVIGGDVLGIPKGVQGPQREAALALAQFLMSREAQAFLVRENAWPAIRNDAYDVPEASQETFRAIQAALEGGWFRPNERYWADVTRAMNEAINRVVLGDEPVVAVLDELHARVEASHPGEYPPGS